MAIVEAAREILRTKLNKCTLEQQDIFNRMYGSIDTIEFDKMEWAEIQIDRTIKLNIKKDKKNG